MLVVLHGRGSTGAELADLATAIPIKARIIAPLGPYPSEGGGFQWSDPAGVVELAEDAGFLYNFLEQIRRCRPTAGKPVVAGYDQGAEVAYLIAADEPVLVSGVVGAGGRPHPELGNVRAPTVALHGMVDEVVPYAAVKEGWDAMVAAGAPLRFIRMFGVGHSFAGALQIKLWQEASRLLAVADPSREIGTRTPSG
jgi:predicted esterase